MTEATMLATLLAVNASPAAVSATRALAPGTLSITAPTTAHLGNGTVGSTVTGPLGSVTVDDGRIGTATTWTATVTSTSFTTTGFTIPAINVKYWSGPATATSGPGTFTPGQPTAAQAVRLDAVRTAFTRTGPSGNNTATWNPTLIVTIPTSAAIGRYTGTITHSVA